VGGGFGACGGGEAGGVPGRAVPGELCGAEIGTTLSSSRGSGGSTGASLTGTSRFGRGCWSCWNERIRS
jgi:hypothetical protein